MATPSNEQRELQLVETVEFKILAVANKEDKLQQLLQRYLAPLILKAASDHAAVRARVIQILARLKTFIQSPEIVLPVVALLDQYKSTDSTLVKQLDLSFIQHSINRIDEYERRNLIPKALQGLAKDEGQQRAGALFNIILRLLLDASIPPRGSKDDEELRTSMGLSQEADSRYLAKLIGIFLRLRTPTGSQTWPQANPALSRSELDTMAVDSPDATKLFQRMSELKTKLVSLLASGAFSDDEKHLPAVYAAASFDGRVASSAEEILKRSSVSLEDADRAKRLFHAHSTLPVVYRTRILNLLSKSAVSVTMSGSVLAVVSLDFLPAQPNSDINDGLQPSSALERTKLHKALFQYLSWVARCLPKNDSTIAPKLIESMRAYVEAQGWPRPDQTSQDDIMLRSRAYATIGLLGGSADMPVAKRLDLAAWLFRSLSEDPMNDAVVNIDGALSSLTENVPPSIGANQPELKQMLLSYMSLSDDPPTMRSTRHAVVKWANDCLPYSDIVGRWIDILAVKARKDERSDVVEQGSKGLDPWTYFAHNANSPSIPEWKAMVVAYFGRKMTAEPMAETTLDSDIVSQSGALVLGNFGGEQLRAFPLALRYCKQLMFLAALDDFKVEPGWVQKLDTLSRTDIAARSKVRQYLREAEKSYLVFYLRACLHGAFVNLEVSGFIEECMRSFVDVASLSPQSVVSDVLDLCPGLSQFIQHNNSTVRMLGAHAAGILIPHPGHGQDTLGDWVTNLQALFHNAKTLSGRELNAAEGALEAFGRVFSRGVYYDRAPSTNLQYPFQLLLEDGVPQSLFHASLDCFSQLWRANIALPPSEGDQSLSKIVERLSKESKKGNEVAIRAFGSLALCLHEDMVDEAGEDTEDWSIGTLGTILTELFALHELKMTEVHFTVGDAITAAVARWDSDYVKVGMDVDGDASKLQDHARTARISAVLTKLFKDCKGTKPSLLKASGIWLFCLVQYCSHLDVVQSRLREAQAAFMRLLNARDELVQETASRGLSLVYERGDSDLKSALTKDLVSAFTGTGTQLKVEDETELFEPGALPTGEGKSVTSYKDIVNLANEVGDQRLVYKFMSLAANAATWSTRSAFGRFGLSNILSDSDVDPKLYPKLYRYRFDPNSNVRRSMDDIWKALVKDSGAVVATHFNAIMEDLLTSVLGREWRTREASCAAIAELIQGQPFPKYEKYYRDIWMAALKVLDDVKGSVREAALRLCMGLSKSLVHQLEEGTNGSAARAMMQEAIPFLLSDKGVENSVQDVQVFATITILDIAKKGGKALRPFIPVMVSKLLGLLSTIEPEQINYQYQRAGEDRREQIDKVRSQMVNQSPISEAIENCLRFIDGDVMSEFGPMLENTIQNAVAMPTKIGCSRVLTTLFTRHIDDIRPMSDRLLKLMQKQTLDKNDEVSQAYARAAAYNIRVVPEDAKLRFSEYYVDRYLQSEDEARRQKISEVIAAVANLSPDHFTAQETILLPFSYLGAHDTDEYTQKMFQKVWDQHAGSSRTVARYVQEIVALVQRCLDTAQWALRHTGAFAVAGMVTDVSRASDATGEISLSTLSSIWPVFDKSLALKTFPGKEKILDAFPMFVAKGKALWESDAQISAQMKKIAIREAKRNNDEYRVHAFRCIWRFVEARDDLDMLQDIADIVRPYLDDLKDEDKMDVDSKEDKTTETAKNGLEAIARGYNRPKMTMAPSEVLSNILDLLQPYLGSPKFQAIKREVWYGCVGDLMKAASKSEAAKVADKDGVWIGYMRSLDMEMPEAGTETQRLSRVKAVSATLDAREKGVFGTKYGVMEGLKETVATALGEERAFEVQKAWREVLERV